MCELTVPLSQVAVTVEAWTRPSNAVNPLTVAEALPPPADTDAALTLMELSDELAAAAAVRLLPWVLDTDGVAPIGAAPEAEIP